jgi:hypothetical protein
VIFKGSETGAWCSSGGRLDEDQSFTAPPKEYSW